MRLPLRPHAPTGALVVLAALVVLVATLLAGAGTVARAAEEPRSAGASARSAAVTAVDAPARRAPAVRRVAAGGEHSCEIRGDRTLWCWGRNTYGQLGLDRTGPGTAIPEQVGGSTAWATVSAGGASTCATRTDASLWCWGVNHRGQLGDGTRDVRLEPTRVAGRQWKQVSTGWFHTCATRADSTLWCWGDDSAGQLGVPGDQDRTTPTRVPGADWKRVSVNGWSTCAVKGDGSLWCWGRNLFGQLGVGDNRDRAEPTRVGTGATWSGVSVSWTHACARTGAGAVSCWGRGDQGQLGTGALAGSTSPVAVAGGHVAKRVAVGEGSSCLIDDAQRRWCWGSDVYGQLGDGSAPGGSSPVPVVGPGTWTDLSLGWLHGCARTSEGQRACVGNDERGQTAVPGTAARQAPSTSPTTVTRREGPLSFRIATFNTVGNGHTRPYAHDDQLAPARMRAEWTARALRTLDADVVGVQEQTAEQLAAILAAGEGEYASFQTPASGDLGVESALLWRRDVWKPVERTVIRTQFISRELDRPVVLLEHRATGRRIWVMAVHNAPWEYQAKRDKAVRAQLARINELEATGVPVFYVGDMNEKETIVCKVMAGTTLRSATGGRYADGRCTPPRGTMRVDWLFGPGDATWDGYAPSRIPLVRLATDHWVPVSRVTLP